MWLAHLPGGASAVRSVLRVQAEETLGWQRGRRGTLSCQEAAEVVFKHLHALLASDVPSSDNCGVLGASLLMLLPLCCVNRILCCLRRDAQHAVDLSFVCCICHSKWIFMQCHFSCTTVDVRRTPDVLWFSVSVETFFCLWNSPDYVVGLPQC